MTSPQGWSLLRELNVICVTEFSAAVTENFLNSDSPVFAECEPYPQLHRVPSQQGTKRQSIVMIISGLLAPAIN